MQREAKKRVDEEGNSFSHVFWRQQTLWDSTQESSSQNAIKCRWAILLSAAHLDTCKEKDKCILLLIDEMYVKLKVL